MNEKKKTLILAALAIVLIAGAAVLYKTLTAGAKDNLVPAGENSSSEADGSSQTEGNSEPELLKAPDFKVTDKDGNEVSLSDFLGKPVVINFWATWCGYCKSEMPDFDEVYKEVGDDVVFMMVNATDGKRETVEKASEFIAKQGYSFPVYYDTLGEASYSYGVSSLPTTYFIDSEGNAVTYARGALDKETLIKGIGYITEK